MIEHDNTITVRFNEVYDSFISNDNYIAVELMLLLERIFISLARKNENTKANLPTLKRSIAHINSNYTKELKIPELAKIESLSASRYTFLFRKVMKCSPGEYVTRLRMTLACELLCSTDLSITEISTLTGYNDSHFFSRTFAKRIGMSPRSYRKSK